MKRSLHALAPFLTVVLVVSGASVAAAAQQEEEESTSPREYSTTTEQQSASSPTSSKAPLGKADPKKKIKDSYIVVLKDDASDPASVADKHASKDAIELKKKYEKGLKGYAAFIPPEKLDKVRSEPEVQFVSEDEQHDLIAQTLPTGVDRVDADLSSTKAGDGSGAVPAVIGTLDTGVVSHPDLRVLGGYNCTTANRADYTDRNGHGTFVAGIVAAKDDDNGVVGTAPAAGILAMKVVPDSTGQAATSDIICGINMLNVYAALGYVKVVNVSLEGTAANDNNCGATNGSAYHKAYCDSVKSYGIQYVAGAGNDGEDSANTVPAAYKDADVIGVSALNDYDGEKGGLASASCPDSPSQTYGPDDTFATYSNYGVAVDIGAPGTCILSTYLDRGLAIDSGTSVATPHVAGAAALYRYRNPSATPADVRAAIEAAGEPEGSGHTDPSGVHPEKVLLMNTF